MTVGEYLVSPDGNVVGSGQNYDISEDENGTTGKKLEATVLKPAAGSWTLVADFVSPTPGTEVADPFTGTISLAPAGAGGPDPARQRRPDELNGSAPDTIPGVFTNTGSQPPEDYFLDPRLTTTATMTLAPLTPALAPGSNASTLPLGASRPARVLGALALDVGHGQADLDPPAMTDLSPYVGRPRRRVGGALSDQFAVRHCRCRPRTPPRPPTSTSGLWQPGPTECGPYLAEARPRQATDTVTVTSLAFDQAMTVQTGDLQQLANGAGAYAKGQPGHRRGRPGRLGHRRRDDQAVGGGGRSRQRHALPR